MEKETRGGERVKDIWMKQDFNSARVDKCHLAVLAAWHVFYFCTSQTLATVLSNVEKNLHRKSQISLRCTRPWATSTLGLGYNTQ